MNDNIYFVIPSFFSYPVFQSCSKEKCYVYIIFLWHCINIHLSIIGWNVDPTWIKFYNSSNNKWMCVDMVFKIYYIHIVLFYSKSREDKSVFGLFIFYFHFYKKIENTIKNMFG